MTDYKLEPIPRDSDGNVIKEEYQELMWFSQQKQTQDIHGMKTKIEDHGRRLNTVESDVRVAKILSRASTVIVGLFAGIIAILKGFKWW